MCEPFKLTGHPTLREVPETQEAAAGTKVTLPCSVSGHPRPVITWVKDGQPLPRGTEINIIITVYCTFPWAYRNQHTGAVVYIWMSNHDPNQILIGLFSIFDRSIMSMFI